MKQSPAVVISLLFGHYFRVSAFDADFHFNPHENSFNTICDQRDRDLQIADFKGNH